jgi:hypothetical protein
MKLYTEEQVRSIIQKARSNEDNWYSDNYLLAEQTPIELPSDEEIEASKFPLNSPEQELWNGGYEDGAKWMRDKIQGGNK